MVLRTVCGMLVVALVPLLASANPPEVPAISRDVALVDNDQFTRPVIPPMRTSNDGRIALNLKSIGGPAFFLMSPEKIDQPFLESPAGAEILASTTPLNLPTSSLHASTNVARRCSDLLGAHTTDRRSTFIICVTAADYGR